MANATYRKVSEKTFSVFLECYGEEKELGSTKLECDAQFHVHAINEAIKAAYDDGYQSGIDYIATGYEEYGQDS